jgi:hypothetical protein
MAKKNDGKSFRSFVETLPYGKSVLAFWDWKGGVLNKALIIFTAVAVVFIFQHYFAQKSGQTATISNANSSPAIQVNQSPNTQVKNNSENPVFYATGNSGNLVMQNGGSNISINQTIYAGPKPFILETRNISQNKTNASGTFETQFYVCIGNVSSACHIDDAKTPNCLISEPTVINVRNGQRMTQNGTISESDFVVTFITSRAVAESEFGSFTVKAVP